MRNLKNIFTGAAVLTIICGAIATTPNPAFGRDENEGTRLEAVQSEAPSFQLPTPPELGDCQNLAAPMFQYVAVRTYAKGVQIYRWNGISWEFQAPEASLYADARRHIKVGIHYGGPTWESNSGSKVVGSVAERCTPDPTAVPWLLLKAVSSSGRGIFRGTTFIQRVNTVGGLAPIERGAFVGEVRRVPYTAEYYFYREEA